MSVGPLQCAIGFWKPLMDSHELQGLACYKSPEEPLSRGINVFQPDSAPKPHRLLYDGRQCSLHAAVHPVSEVPDGAEVIAEVTDWSGQHCSYVLWYPGSQSIVVPFDSQAAVEAFWYEMYVSPKRRTSLPGPILSLYYRTLKPLLPRGVKKWARRLLAHRVHTEDQFLEWPSDDSLDSLQRLLLHLILLASRRDTLQFVWFWPEQHSWAALLTHDVETAAGLRNASRIAEMESERGLRSVFNMVPLDYEVTGSQLHILQDAGFEIGVHGYTHDGMIFSSWKTFLRRVVTVNECARQWGASGFRSPATFRNQDWFHMLGFEYDSSVADTDPFEPQPGGCGSLFPFFVDGLVELPITLPQDHTLFALLRQQDASTWLVKLERIRRSNGMACVLTHPDPASGYIGDPENERRYRELLDVLADSDAWIPLPRDLARWWRARAAVASNDVEGLPGGSTGTAQLDGSGGLEIVPPFTVRTAVSGD
ncbi:MAG: hypothetical protein CVT67_11620 [Actinobacteria bacterium HGW-Actinobacteria-7]|nr:MAG: hypothetical protein CVT67_11620 [Actinobacteria bacterium HGW-Actinobacteria-7]